MTEVLADKLKLGQVSVDHDAFGLDLKINEGYQAYSAELLRLALLVLTGLSAVWIKVYLLTSAQNNPWPNDPAVPTCVCK
jgi:hypothetical protein